MTPENFKSNHHDSKKQILGNNQNKINESELIMDLEDPRQCGNQIKKKSSDILNICDSSYYNNNTNNNNANRASILK